MTGRIPDSTYRLQLTPEFGFAQAARQADYLADLGVSHVYLSPVLEAVPGSGHGYDVTDHSRIRAELGGEAGLRALADRLRARGLGIILDIVPNHMAVPSNLALNRQLWSVLRDGPGSSRASWFDIDWAAQDDRMLLPVLSGPLSACLGDLRVEAGGGPDGEPVLRYFDHVLPLRHGTARLPMRDLLAAQHYRLAWWRDAATELNWRRFFDISSLIAVRVEEPAVFDATHDVIIALVADGVVEGLRVDHPDGLADPRGYLSRLTAATRGAWIVAEKILAADEALPADWPCAGTTGYDTLRLIDGVFLDQVGGGVLAAGYARFVSRPGNDRAPVRFADVALEAKREVAAGTLAAEVSRIARLLGPSGRDASPGDARMAVIEVLASFPVYRAYVNPGEHPSAAAQTAIASAVNAARGRLPPRLHALAAELAAAALGLRPSAGVATDRAAEFAVRFQQTTGSVLAKGVEDTACYRWARFAALNEVGGDPDRFGVTPAEFHAAAERLAGDWPATMTTLSTHDTKRQEDVRARLAVLAEIPADWGRRVSQWHDHAVAGLSPGRAATAVDPDTEYLFWQTLVGAWPISGGRLAGYLTKAVREAKRQTSWTASDPEYEAAVLGLAARVLNDPQLTRSIADFVAEIAPDALVNSLGAKLAQLTMPGVPDVYQGCELTGLSLVDPDNRRDADFPRCRSVLADLDAGRGASMAAEQSSDGRDAAKMLVTSRALRLRRTHPDWFSGGHAPLTAVGPAASHAIAFQRGGGAITVATRLPAGLRRAGGWSGTTLALPVADDTASGAAGIPAGTPGKRKWVDALTGAVYQGGQVALAELTRALPVALLVPESR